MKKSWSITGFVLLLALLSGSAAGIIASILTDQSISRYIASLENQDTFVTLSREKPRPLPGTHEEAVDRVIEVSQPTIAAIRKKSEDAKTAKGWIFEDEIAGFGSVITSDGWVLFHQSAVAETAKVTEMEVWIAGSRYIPERMVEDTLTDLVLVKIPARDLPTSAFGAAEAMHGGELLFALTGWREMRVSSLIDGDNAFIREPHLAGVFATSWVIETDLPLSAPLFNAAGELVGVGEKGQNAVPLHHAMPFIRSFLKDGKVSHARIGAYVVDVASILNISEDLRGNPKRGALIVSPSRGNAILADSEAEIAGLQAGDVILALDDILVNEQNSLAELLANYTQGAVVDARILREKQEIKLRITLDSHE